MTAPIHTKEFVVEKFHYEPLKLQRRIARYQLDTIPRLEEREQSLMKMEIAKHIIDNDFIQTTSDFDHVRQEKRILMRIWIARPPLDRSEPHSAPVPIKTERPVKENLSNRDYQNQRMRDRYYDGQGG